MAEYAHPESLVNTEWVAEHGNDANVRLIEVDVDTSAYEQGHIAGAVGWNWQSQLQQTVSRDVIGKAGMEQLLGAAGVDNDTTVIVYGDNNNWFAAWAFWQMKYYGHGDVRLMNGGRVKWLAENRPVTTEVAAPAAKTYRASDPDESILGGRAGPCRVQRRTVGPGKPSPGGFPAGRPHTGRGQRSLGAGRCRRRDLQKRRRPGGALRRQGNRRQPGDHRLLPNRRAFFPHLVRVDAASRSPQRPQLRRFLDRVGQHRRSSYRKALNPCAAFGYWTEGRGWVAGHFFRVWKAPGAGFSRAEAFVSRPSRSERVPWMRDLAPSGKPRLVVKSPLGF